MWHNGNSKWGPIYVSRYKQCHFRAGRGFVFKPDTNNNRRYGNEEMHMDVLLPVSQNVHAIYLSTDFFLVTSIARTCVHFCRPGNVNCHFLATRSPPVEWPLISPRFLRSSNISETAIRRKKKTEKFQEGSYCNCVWLSNISTQPAVLCAPIRLDIIAALMQYTVALRRNIFLQVAIRAISL